VRQRIEDYLSETASARDLQAAGAGVRDDGVARSIGDWLRFPELNGSALLRLVPGLRVISASLLEEAIEDHRYAPYLRRQEAEIVRLRGDDAARIPSDMDYASVPGLSTEMIERLSLARPGTLGAARRIRGVTPAALAAILVRARKKAA
jgi:tRNA uridine 5-carboxymethylaminomethyl modification enzyme